MQGLIDEACGGPNSSQEKASVAAAKEFQERFVVPHRKLSDTAADSVKEVRRQSGLTMLGRPYCTGFWSSLFVGARDLFDIDGKLGMDSRRHQACFGSQHVHACACSPLT